jgi:hypothetical protein
LWRRNVAPPARAEMESSSERTVRLPSFDGKMKSFLVWWVHFRVYATVNKFVTALKPIDEADFPASEDEVLDETNKAGLAKAAARRRNAVAMTNYYAMAFTCETTLGMIVKSSLTDWPTGKASKVTDLLLRKIKPHDVMTRVELRQELNKIKMKKMEIRLGYLSKSAW